MSSKERHTQSKKERFISMARGGEDNEMIFSARDRFSGALQFAADKDSSSSGAKKQLSDNSSWPSSPMKSPTKSPGRPTGNGRRRRRKEIQRDSMFHHTFVMKLFDRSVDLAQFPERTSLYPVCRAWMKNQPHNTRMAPRVRTPTPEPLSDEEEDEEEGEKSEDPDGEDNHEDENHSEEPLDKKPRKEKRVYKMPAFIPLERDVDHPNFVSPRIPESLPVTLDENFDINKEHDDSPSSAPAMLLSDHMVRWWQVRKRWRQAAKDNEKRYDESNRVLKNMFEK